MSSNRWKLERLQNLCSYITDGKHGDCKNQDNSGYYFLSAKDVFDGKLSYEHARQITKEDFQDTHKRTRLEPYDILLTNSGTIGRMAIATDHDLTSRTTFQKSVALLKPIKEKVFPGFLYYCLTARKTDIVNTACGTTQKNLLLGDLRAFEIKIPESMETQRRISDILSTLDDKIELNRQTNATLEAVAQAIFKEWFVNFNFPGATGEMIESELGLIPKGWRVASLTSELNIVYGHNLPTSKLIEQGYPVFGGNGIIGFYDKYLYDEPQVIVACRGAASGKVNQSLPKSFVTNNSLVFEIPKNSTITFPYLKFFCLNTDFTSFVSGSAQPQLTIESLMQDKFLVPESNVISKFSQVVSAVEQMKIDNDIQSKSLSIIRDSLLPKLMSGEIEV